MSKVVKIGSELGAALTSAANIAEMAKIYQGMPYVSSLPGSPAEKAGLRWGDIVLSVNGVPTPDASAFIAARTKRDNGATIRFVRHGVENEVELSW